jgi:hypothetical protein
MKTTITQMSGAPFVNVADARNAAATPSVTTAVPVHGGATPSRKRRGNHLRLVR